MARRMTVAGLVALIVCLAAGTLAASQQGQPFDRVWAAISQLAARVSTLEAATPAPSGPVVVNGAGTQIGLLSGSGSLHHYDGTRWLLINSLGQGGFTSSFVGFLWDQQNCSGNRYLPVFPANDKPLAPVVTVQNGTGHYAAEPFGVVTIRSRLFSNGTCNGTPAPESVWVGAVAQFDIASLGPGPFSVR